MIAHALAALHIATPAWAADAVQKADSIPSWVAWLLAAVVVPFVWPWVKKWVAASIAKDFLRAIKAALAAGDEDDDVLILAFVKWVRIKTAKLDLKGAAAYEFIAKWICARVPILKGREALVAELAEACDEAVGEAAAEIEKEGLPTNKPDPASTLPPPAPPSA